MALIPGARGDGLPCAVLLVPSYQQAEGGSCHLTGPATVPHRNLSLNELCGFGCPRDIHRRLGRHSAAVLSRGGQACHRPIGLPYVKQARTPRWKTGLLKRGKAASGGEKAHLPDHGEGA